MKRFYLQMHITNKCNNRCRQCYQENYDDIEISFNTAEKILQELSKIGKELGVNSEVSITGGNPIMAKDFLKITGKAKDLCSAVRILGNPEGLNKNVIAYLKKINIDGFQLSLDGIQKTHNYLRSKGSFQRTVKAISNLANAGIKVFVNATISEINYLEKNDIENIAKSFGANSVSFEDCIPPNEDCKGKKDCSLGFASMAILPDLTLMACRRTNSSVLGKWNEKMGLAYHFVYNEKMKNYRLSKGGEKNVP